MVQKRHKMLKRILVSSSRAYAFTSSGDKTHVVRMWYSFPKPHGGCSSVSGSCRSCGSATFDENSSMQPAMYLIKVTRGKSGNN